MAKRFGEVVAVDGVDLRVGARLVLHLPRPVGLRQDHLPAPDRRLRAADAGDVRIGGRSMVGVPAYRRPVNMVFQHYALFPHLDVAANVAYGLRQRAPRPTRARSTGGSTRRWSWCACRAMGRAASGSCPAASSSASRWPARWSTADRAAARRAAGGAGPQAAPRHADRAAEPAARGRHHLRPGHPRPGGGAVDERHDLRHARRADRAAGLARALYDAPANACVADFVGKSNFLAGKVAAVGAGTAEIVAGGRVDARPARRRAGDALRPASRRAGGAAGDGAPDGPPGRTSPAAQVLNRIFLGEHTEYLVRTPDLGDLLALVPRAAEADSGFAPGDDGGAGAGRESAALALPDDRQAE